MNKASLAAHTLQGVSLPAIKVKLHLDKSLSCDTMYNVVLLVGGLG